MCFGEPVVSDARAWTDMEVSKRCRMRDVGVPVIGNDLSSIRIVESIRVA